MLARNRLVRSQGFLVAGLLSMAMGCFSPEDQVEIEQQSYQLSDVHTRAPFRLRIEFDGGANGSLDNEIFFQNYFSYYNWSNQIMCARLYHEVLIDGSLYIDMFFIAPDCDWSQAVLARELEYLSNGTDPWKVRRLAGNFEHAPGGDWSQAHSSGTTHVAHMLAGQDDFCNDGPWWQGPDCNYPSIHVYIAPPGYPAQFLDTSTMRDNGPDWDYCRGKATCATGEYITGMSEIPGGPGRTALCKELSSVQFSGSVTATLTLDAGTNQRRAERMGDWAPWYWKLECGAGEYVRAVSENAPQCQGDARFHAIQCAAGQGLTDICSTRVFDAGDNQGTSATGDWDYGAYKGECADNEYVAGVSVDPGSGYLHSLLCCVIGAP